MPVGRRLFLLLRNNETAQSIAIAIPVPSVIIGLFVLFLEWPASEIRAVAFTNYSTIDYNNVTCVSITPRGPTVEARRFPIPKYQS